MEETAVRRLQSQILFGLFSGVQFLSGNVFDVAAFFFAFVRKHKMNLDNKYHRQVMHALQVPEAAFRS